MKGVVKNGWMDGGVCWWKSWCVSKSGGERGVSGFEGEKWTDKWRKRSGGGGG